LIAALLANFLAILAPLQTPSALAQSGIAIEHPVTIRDVLINLRTVIGQGLLLNEGFYVASSLNKNFGGAHLEVYVRDSKMAMVGNLTSFDRLARRVELGNGKSVDGIGLTFDWARKTDGSVSASLDIIFRTDTDVTFEEVETIFGSDWKYDSTPPSPHKILKPRTKANGNATIVYEYAARKIRQIVKIEFGHDATLSSVLVLSREGP